MTKILIIDDSKAYNNTFSSSLKRPGYKILQAYTLKEARQVLKSNHNIDFIFLDLFLPDGEGDELLNEIDRNKHLNPKIIILSGNDDIQRRNFLFEKGVIDYFIKEMPLKIIIQDVHKLITSLNTNKQKNILVVDDSSFVRKTITNILESKNYNIYSANDPLNAFKILKEKKMDLIFSDLEMPKMDGVEFLEKIKNNDNLKNIPVIILSGKKNSMNYSRVLKHGAIDFIEKPFLTEEILLKSDIHISQSNYIEQIAEQNMQLEQSISNLKQTQTKLIESEKMSSLGDLVVGMAHEINTPVGVGLTGVTHILEITKSIKNKYNSNEISNEDFDEYLTNLDELSNFIYESLNKISHLVKTFKQISTTQETEKKSIFNLNNRIKDIIQCTNFISETSNLNIEIKCDKSITINSYAEAFLLIISNLITNSIDACKQNQKGNVLIEVIKENANIKLIYKDDGIGIPNEYLSKIFDPFFTTNRISGGKGLGLNIIYNIVTSKLNGTIGCKSKEGEGVIFTINLPI